MKCTQHLSVFVIPKYTSQYMRYDDMKELLVQTVTKAQP